MDTKDTWIEYVKRQPAPYVYRELDHIQVELHGDVALTLGRYFYLPRSNSTHHEPPLRVVRACVCEAGRAMAASLPPHT